MLQTAQIAVADATIYYDKLYTYAVPASIQGHIFVGSIVLVPFGRGKSQPRIGVVLAIEEKETVDTRVKEICDVAPEDACLTVELLSIVKYLKEATFCTWFEAVRAMIPFGAQYKTKKTETGWALQKQISRHTEPIYTLAQNPPVQKRRPSPAQMQVLEILKQSPMRRSEILLQLDIGRTVLDTMLKNGLVKVAEKDKYMLLNEDHGVNAAQTPSKTWSVKLSQKQQQIVDDLKQKMMKPAPKPALLYGVTGSGKTPMFLTLVQQALQSGKTALVLVPEIGLTPQMLNQLSNAFGEKVAVQHSRLNNTERLLQWRKIQRGETPVVVGTRSAVFAPLENIGLIVIDEEQERSYQSESAPRYDAVAVARRRAAYHGALLLLASATPAVVDYYYAKKGAFELFTLNQRFRDLPLPTVQMVDMREELAQGNTGVLSSRLVAEISKNIEAKEQTVLLLNRRGYHRVGMCRECGETLKCTECSVPMVYHKAQVAGQNSVSDGQTGHLLCHYCGRTENPAPSVCPHCEGELRYTGFGTQRMEEELQEKLPNVRVLRMDMDSTSRKGAHSKMLASFASGNYDILLGTQMVAKGLDFEKVSLVGVIGIDSLLFSPGYRAVESVFSLVTQVVGRAGRANIPGRALLQTTDPLNPVLNLAAAQDYEEFYQQEISFRKLGLYPPFCTICVAGFVAKTETDAIKASRRFAQILAGHAAKMQDVPLRILGPAPMQIMQLAGSFRYRLTIKCRADGAFRALAQAALAEYNKEGWPRKTTIWLDLHADGV